MRPAIWTMDRPRHRSLRKRKFDRTVQLITVYRDYWLLARDRVKFPLADLSLTWQRIAVLIQTSSDLRPVWTTNFGASPIWSCWRRVS